MTKKINIREIWRSQSLMNNGGNLKCRIDELSDLRCYIGTIVLTKAKVFYLEFTSEVDKSIKYYNRFSGVEVQILPMSNQKQELVIILCDPELSEIFTLFIEDVIKQLIEIKESNDALRIISQRITYWKKLFSRFKKNLLNAEKQRGLYGELFFLKTLLEKRDNNINIIETWHGPEGTNQDFYLNRNSVEVKTSQQIRSTIKISNELQLDVGGSENLYLIYYETVEYPMGENTLYDVILDVRKLLHDTFSELSLFNQKLETLGISIDMEEEYVDKGYVVRHQRFYRVTDGFPKITKSMFPSSVSSVSYNIDPNDCSKFEISLEELFKELSYVKK